MNVLTFDHVSCRYPGQGTDIVDRLSFEVKPGSFHCILGVSGCGKSTLFRMISGLMSPEKGSIYVNGKPVCGHGSYCGYMPQKDMLFPWRSVGENLALPLEIQRKLGKKEQRQQVEAALAEVGLAGCADKRPDELSGGMRQRAAFARTMLSNPRILILDEATSSIDTKTELLVQKGIAQMLKGRTSFVIAHRLSTIQNADRIFVIDKGGIVESGTPAELMAKKGAYYKLRQAQFA